MAPTTPNTNDLQDKNLHGVSNSISMKQKHLRTPCSKSTILQELFSFVREDKSKYAVCKSCPGNPRIKMTNSNTTGVKRHVQRFHSEKFKEAYNVADEQEPGSSLVEEKFSKMIVEWISVKYLPFDFFEDNETQDLFHYLNSKITLPTKEELETHVASTFHKWRNGINVLLGKLKSKISLTIDGWTCVSNEIFYRITTHFVDENWQWQSIVLSYVPSYEKSIASSFCNILRDFNLLRRIQSITVDNVVANSNFIDELKMYLEVENIDFDIENQNLRCLAHTFHSGVHEMLRLVGSSESEEDLYNQNEEENSQGANVLNLSILQKLRETFRRIQNDDYLQEMLKNYCTINDIAIIELTFDLCTKWNSTFSMIKAALHLRTALIDFCENNKELQNLNLDPLDWTLLTEAFKILRNYETISSELSGDKHPNLTMAVLGFNMLLEMLDNKIDSLSKKENCKVADEFLISALEDSRDKILNYYPKRNWIYCIALILDPRHKVETFSFTSWGKELESRAVQKFEEIFRMKYYVKEESERIHENFIIEDDDVINVSSMFESEAATSTLSTEDNWRKEIYDYLSTKRAEKNQDILQWWKRHESIYPNLSRMAADILSTPATSIPTEILFSRASLTIHKQRNGLKRNSAETILCLNSWISSPLYKKIQNID